MLSWLDEVVEDKSLAGRQAHDKVAAGVFPSRIILDTSQQQQWLGWHNAQLHGGDEVVSGERFPPLGGGHAILQSILLADYGLTLSRDSTQSFRCFRYFRQSLRPGKPHLTSSTSSTATTVVQAGALESQLDVRHVM